MFVLLAFLAIVVVFLTIGLVGVALFWIISTAVTGLVIGALARLLLPGSQPIGILATIVCGWAGALIGSGIGNGFGFHRWETLLIEIGAAAVGVGVWSASNRRRRVASAGHHHRVIDI